MGNLLNNGFHLGEVVDFLERSGLVERNFVAKMRHGLAAGRNLATILDELHFSKSVVTQIALAEVHGDLSGTLVLIERNIRKHLAVRKKLLALSIYPVMLLVFLTGIIFGLRSYLLPQISGDEGGWRGNFATLLINHLPELIGGGVLTLLCLTILSMLFFKKQTSLLKYSILVRIPLLADAVRLYLTGYFAHEWGNLIAQGVDLRNIFELMSTQKSQIFSEVGSYLANGLVGGLSFSDLIAGLEFFQPELHLMIEYGEIKNKLGIELEIYGDECWEQFFVKIERMMQWIQPIVFLFVALMIVLLYVAMLLPIYANMGNGL